MRERMVRGRECRQGVAVSLIGTAACKVVIVHYRKDSGEDVLVCMSAQQAPGTCPFAYKLGRPGRARCQYRHSQHHGFGYHQRETLAIGTRYQ